MQIDHRHFASLTLWTAEATVGVNAELKNTAKTNSEVEALQYVNGEAYLDANAHISAAESFRKNPNDSRYPLSRWHHFCDKIL